MLVASLGVGAISYVACGGTAVANLVAPPPHDAGMKGDAAHDATGASDAPDAAGPPDATVQERPMSFDLVANLVAPLP